MMFITKFNKLIKNKLVWAILLVFIVLVFIDWASARSDRASLFDVVITSIVRIFNPEHARLDDAAATLDNQPVSKQEYAEALTHAQLSIALMLGRPVEKNPRLAQMVEHLAWRRMATLKKTHRLGLAATQQEIDHALFANPAFQENGKFSQSRFQGFLNEYLPSLLPRQAYGASSPQQQFETFRKVIAEELDMSRMRNVIGDAALVSPLELAQTFSQLHDTFLVSYVLITPADLPENPTTTLADARAYYETHTNDFWIPNQRRVRYVSFPIEDHLDVGAVTDDLMENYYYSNMQRFTRQDSNGVPLTIPFEYVEDDIRIKIATEDAKQATIDLARDFLDCLEPEGNLPAPDFSAVAVASGLTVYTTEFFTARSAPADAHGADSEFTKAAFALGEASEGSASYPVEGEDAVYILSLAERKDAHTPGFEEVSNKAMRLAFADAEDRAMQDFVASLRARAEQQLARGRTFDEIAAEAGLPINTTEPFTVTSGMEVESELFQTLMHQAILRNSGELSEPVKVRDGYMLAFLESRQPGDPATYNAIRFDLARYMQQRKADMLFAQWQESLVSSNRFVSLLPKTPQNQYEDESDVNSDFEDSF